MEYVALSSNFFLAHGDCRHTLICVQFSFCKFSMTEERDLLPFYVSLEEEEIFLSQLKSPCFIPIYTFYYLFDFGWILNPIYNIHVQLYNVDCELILQYMFDMKWKLARGSCKFGTHSVRERWKIKISEGAEGLENI